MKSKVKVLFICIHNSARSQMAEEFLRLFGGEKFEAESAGFEATEINPLVVRAMKEEGVDLTGKRTQSVFNLYNEKKFFGYVITVCNKAKESDCPIFPGNPTRIHWDLENPEDFIGTEEEKMEMVRELRDKIKQMVQQFIYEFME
ncbi:arsenate reductase ArsC [Desulfosporosinus fructosivorans]|uniref:Arsenate reductase ArsC n=1 Tax=Desulfosporosinus fructosivorans TaxID=2018669 RepID=A0A4Z0R8J4_9FIRM|nr:arsenate reductase ArsC [Desulfosporosinus fructosivorans]TGE38754.1 arsenate reductase ArsC [Desulfosporosinus fructosivorans]